MDLLRRRSPPSGIPIVEAAALLEEGHLREDTVGRCDGCDVIAAEMKNERAEDTTGDNHNIQPTDNCLPHVIELIGCRDEASFRSFRNVINLTSVADLALLEPDTDFPDLFPNDVLAKRRLLNMVTFVKNGKVITLNTTMADIIQSNKQAKAEVFATRFSMILYPCLSVLYVWIIFLKKN